MSVSRSPAGFISLCQIESVTSISRSDYAMSAKITRVGADSPAQSFDLLQRHAPYIGPRAERRTAGRRSASDVSAVRRCYSTCRACASTSPAVQAVAIYGKRQKLQVNAGVNTADFS